MKNRHFAAEIRFFSALRISIEVNSILLSERNVRLRTSIILHFGVLFLSISLSLPLSHSISLSLPLSRSFSFFLAKGYASTFAFYLFVLFGTTRQRHRVEKIICAAGVCFVQRKESMRKNLPAFSLYRYTSDYMSRDKCLRYTNALPDHRYYTSTVNNGDRYSDND